NRTKPQTLASLMRVIYSGRNDLACGNSSASLERNNMLLNGTCAGNGSTLKRAFEYWKRLKDWNEKRQKISRIGISHKWPCISTLLIKAISPLRFLRPSQRPTSRPHWDIYLQIWIRLQRNLAGARFILFLACSIIAASSEFLILFTSSSSS